MENYGKPIGDTEMSHFQWGINAPFVEDARRCIVDWETEKYFQRCVFDPVLERFIETACGIRTGTFRDYIELREQMVIPTDDGRVRVFLQQYLNLGIRE